MHCNATASLGVPGSALLATLFFVTTVLLLFKAATAKKHSPDVIGFSLLQEVSNESDRVSDNDSDNNSNSVI